ncbi:MAG TPA: ABC transporter permease [Candidatus Limnocylindria bacterium]|jgi:osmoprotectant transport system permease protein|nr:ABC transporter permease [Candidatus Limnocylindria bacterium]
MDFLGQVLAWYTDPANWTGNNAIPLRLWQHLSLSVASLAAGLAIALPIGLYIGHTGRGARVAVAVSNIGRAVPSLGWLGIAYPISTGLFQRAGIGFLPAFIGLVALAIPPIVTNTHAGLRDVDAELREAARGMGMRELQLLMRLEVPVALTVILAGIRVSAVAVVATTPLAALVGGGTLGAYILQGLALSDEVRVFAAAVMVALLAVLTELAFAWLQRRLVSPGLGAPDGAPWGEPSRPTVETIASR